MDRIPPNAPPYAEALLLMRELVVRTDPETLRDLAAAVLHIVNDDQPGVHRAATQLRARCILAEMLRAAAASSDALEAHQRKAAVTGVFGADGVEASLVPPPSTLAYAASILDWSIGTPPAVRVAAILRKHAGVCLGEDLQRRHPGPPSIGEYREAADALERAAEEHAELWGGGLHLVSGWLVAQARALSRVATGEP